MKWKYGNASEIGTSHLNENMVCQDYSTCELIDIDDSNQFLIAIASDGAGSAKNSQRGSHEICEFIKFKINDYLINGNPINSIDKNCIQSWIFEYQKKIKFIAENEGAAINDFSCTIIAAVIGNNDAIFFQLGDGAMVVSSYEDSNEYSWIFWPQRGEYENETYFATDKNSVIEHLEFDYIDKPILEIALFTDGIQGLALNYQNKIAHSPFFIPFFTYFRSLTPGYSNEASNLLSLFLRSEKINLRTNDDKTLVLATRFE